MSMKCQCIYPVPVLFPRHLDGAALFSVVIGHGWGFRVLGIGCSSFLKNNEAKVKH